MYIYNVITFIASLLLISEEHKKNLKYTKQGVLQHPLLPPLLTPRHEEYNIC